MTWAATRRKEIHSALQKINFHVFDCKKAMLFPNNTQQPASQMSGKVPSMHWSHCTKTMAKPHSMPGKFKMSKNRSFMFALSKSQNKFYIYTVLHSCYVWSHPLCQF